MDKCEGFNAKIAAASSVVGRELQALATDSNQASHVVASYALENVLLHQAVAQQLNGVASNLVTTGQQLLATSRQLEPQLDHLAAVAEAADMLHKQAESLTKLGSTMHQLQQLKQQQQEQGGVQQEHRQQPQRDANQQQQQEGPSAAQG